MSNGLEVSVIPLKLNRFKNKAENKVQSAYWQLNRKCHLYSWHKQCV